MKPIVNNTMWSSHQINISTKQIDLSYLYQWEWSEILRDMDTNPDMIYTKTVHAAIKQIVHTLTQCPSLQDTVFPLLYWKDIGTWNWILTAQILCKLFQSSINPDFLIKYIAKITKNNPQLFSYLWFESIFDDMVKINTIYDHSDIVIIEYYDINKRMTFEQWHYESGQIITIRDKYWDMKDMSSILNHSPNHPVLITLFNIFPNFERDTMYNILQDIYNHIHDYDIVVPSFFQHYEDQIKKDIAISLYDNDETDHRIKTAIQKAYELSWDYIIPKTSEKSENNRTYIDVWGYDIVNNTYYRAFKSYRDNKENLSKLFTSIGFHIIDRLESSNGLIIAPILTKSNKKTPSISR